MDQKDTKDIQALWAEVKTYINLRLEELRLKAVEKVSKIMADLITILLMITFAVMAFLAACITLAFYLSDLLNSYTQGFGCTALIFLAIAVITLLAKDRYIEKWISNMTVRRYFEKHFEEDEEEELAKQSVN